MWGNEDSWGQAFQENISEKTFQRKHFRENISEKTSDKAMWPLTNNWDSSDSGVSACMSNKSIRATPKY